MQFVSWFVQLDRFAVAEHNRRVRELRVRKNIENTIRSVRHHTSASKQFLFCITAGMLPPPQDVIENMLINLQASFLADELVYRGTVHPDDFRLHISSRGAEVGH